MTAAEVNASRASIDGARQVFGQAVGHTYEDMLDRMRTLIGTRMNDLSALGGLNVYPVFTQAVGLPAANAANNGLYAIATGFATVTNGAAPTGAGAISVLVQSNGSIWACQ